MVLNYQNQKKIALGFKALTYGNSRQFVRLGLSDKQIKSL